MMILDDCFAVAQKKRTERSPCIVGPQRRAIYLLAHITD